METRQTINKEGARRTYVVVLRADDGSRVCYYTCAASTERAQELACAAELAPTGAVLSVRVSEFEEGGR